MADEETQRVNKIWVEKKHIQELMKEEEDLTESIEVWM